MNKVIRLFLDTDMRNQHAGLVAVAQEKGVKLQELAQGEHVIFINQKLNRVKVYSKGNVLSYLYKSKGSIDLSAFGEIASSFTPNGRIDFDAAIRKTLLKKLGNREAETSKYLTAAKARVNLRSEQTLER